jgi:MFS family permease
MAVVAIVAVVWLVPTSRDPGAEPVDRSSALRWWGALTASIFAIIEGPQQGWSSPIVIGSAVVAVFLFWAFARNESRSPAPLVPACTARDPRLRWGAATVFALFFGLLGVQFVLTQWLQGPLGRSPLGASIYFVPNALASVGAALANPRAVARFGHGVVATGGLISLAVGAAAAGVGVGIDSLGVVIAGGVLIGAAVGIASASAIELIMSSAPPEKAGSAAGVNETLVEAAGAFGVAVLGSVFAATGSYAWPLPVASVVAVIVAVGVKATLVRRRASPQSPLAPPA